MTAAAASSAIPRERCYRDTLAQAVKGIGFVRKGKSPVVTCTQPFMPEEQLKAIEKATQAFMECQKEHERAGRLPSQPLSAQNLQGCGDQWEQAFDQRIQTVLDPLSDPLYHDTKMKYQELTRLYKETIKGVVSQASHFGKIGKVTLILRNKPAAPGWHRDFDDLGITGIKRILLNIQAPPTEFALVDPETKQSGQLIQDQLDRRELELLHPAIRHLTVFGIATQKLGSEIKTGETTAAWHRAPQFPKENLRGLILVDILPNSSLLERLSLRTSLVLSALTLSIGIVAFAILKLSNSDWQNQLYK